MSKDNELVEKIEKISASLTAEEVATLIAIRFEPFLVQIKDELKKYRPAYIHEQTGLSIQTILSFFSRNANFQSKTLIPLINLFVELKTNSLPPSHYGRKNPQSD